MADASSRPVGWAPRSVPPTPRSIVELIRVRTLDAELAATLWLLIESRVPVVVVGPTGGSGRSTLLTALLDFLPAGVRTREVAATDEDFAWLPQATELGWSGTPSQRAGVPAEVRPDTTVVLLPELADDVPGAVWSDEARVAIRAASIGYGVAATIRADGLQGLFDRLRRPPVAVTDDELSRLGAVLVLDRHRDGVPRVAAAHYVRPVARDEHGHVQRLGPAVLATWDAAGDAFEHFGWGVTPELALRVGRRAGDYESEADRRQGVLEGLVAAGVTGVDDVRRAIAETRAADPTTVHEESPA